MIRGEAPVTMFPKPSKGARLRTKQAAKAKEVRELSALYRKVYERDDYHCRCCLRRVYRSGEVWNRAHPHHIIPRSVATKAIKHTTANVCTLCPGCHDAVGKTLFITGNANTVLRIDGYVNNGEKRHA